MTESVRERAKIYTDALRSGRIYGGTEIANFIEELLDQPSPDLSKTVEALKEAENCILDIGSGKGGWAWEEVAGNCREAYEQLTREG